jgi:hypothetical protein
MRGAGRSATLVMGPWAHTNQRNVVGHVNFGFAANPDFMGMQGRLIDIQLDWFQGTIGEDGEAPERTRARFCCSSGASTSGARRRNGPCREPWTRTSTCAPTDA